MSRLKSILSGFFGIWYVKYAFVCVVGILFVGFLDDNSVWAHIRNKQRIQELKEEIAVYDEAYQRDQARIRDLQRNPKAMEKIARERYFMKQADEDIFVLSDDLKSQDN
jgi:cell division protein FtsB